MSFAPKKILVCTDFSAHSQAAADAALDLARQFSGTLTLVHVVPLSTYVDFADSLGQSESWSANVQQMVSARAEANLSKEVERLAASGIKIDRVKTDGAAQSEVARIAEVEKADLVVCSSHGRTGLKHILLGSVAEGIVRHCRCPVLVLHGLATSKPA
jgi:nucleotide-binding universal stress UspA family protein